MHGIIGKLPFYHVIEKISTSDIEVNKMIEPTNCSDTIHRKTALRPGQHGSHSVRFYHFFGVIHAVVHIQCLQFCHLGQESRGVL